MLSVEITAKNVEQAIAEGLKKLDKTIDQVDVKIISSGGIFRKAKVIITVEGAQPIDTLSAQSEKEKPTLQDKHEKTEKQGKSENAKPLKEVKNEPTKAESVKPLNVHPPEDTKTENTFNKFASNNQEADRAPKKQGEFNKNFSREDRGSRRSSEGKREVIIPTEQQTEKAREFLTNTLKMMNIVGTVNIKVEDGLRMVVDTEDSAIIGYRGEVLDTLCFLTGLVINEGKDKYVHLSLDALGYREKRAQTLVNVAKKMAEKAIKTEKKVSLEPMTSGERRVIHAALSDFEGVITKSEGSEPHRHLVIYPKKK